MGKISNHVTGLSKSPFHESKRDCIFVAERTKPTLGTTELTTGSEAWLHDRGLMLQEDQDEIDGAVAVLYIPTSNFSELGTFNWYGNGDHCFPYYFKRRSSPHSLN